MTPTLHGIRNCDTVRKARLWLDTHAIEHGFRDYKTTPPAAAELQAWCAEHGWERLLNRQGTTFRKLPEDARENLDESRAIALMLAQPSIIRRPLLALGGRSLIGFSPPAYAAAFPSR